MRGSLKEIQVKRVLPKGVRAWRIIVSLGRQPNGKYKPKWLRFYGTRKEAESKLAEVVSQVNRREFVEPMRMTLGEWLDEWLEKAIRPPRCAQNTYVAYEGIIKNHLKPHLGNYRLQVLSPLDVERYYAEQSVSLGSRTLAVHHAVLTGALKAAERRGLIRHNVAQRTTNKPKIAASEDALHNVWSAEETKQFLQHLKREAGTQWTAFFALAIDAGLRKSELLALTWQDLTGSTLKVERQLLSIGRDAETGEVRLITSLPKTKRARSLELSQETLALLNEHRRHQAEVKMKDRPRYRDFNLIFAIDWECGQKGALGMPLDRSHVGRRLKAFSKAAGVRPITIHGLRHTCATLALQAGVQPNVVQRRLGHNGVEMTLNIYAHVFPDQQADAASRIAAKIF